MSAKTIRNFYIRLSAFFTWASQEFDLPSPLKLILASKFEEPPIEPFTKEEVEALLKACEFSQEVQTTDRRKFTMRRATGKRDQLLGKELGVWLCPTGRRKRLAWSSKVYS